MFIYRQLSIQLTPKLRSNYSQGYRVIFNTIFNFFTDSREDARHIISNSKDQSIKLWDLRKFANNQCISLTKDAIRHRGWDYRWGSGQCPGKT